jgi:hypothetical protein
MYIFDTRISLQSCFVGLSLLTVEEKERKKGKGDRHQTSRHSQTWRMASG